MNSYNKYLPSLKDEGGSPTELVSSNEPFSQLMCNIILTALPFNFASSFWAAKGAKNFPVCVKTLKADLQLIEPAYSVTAKLAAQVKLNAKTASGTAPEKGKDLGRPRLRPVVGKILQGLTSIRRFVSIVHSGASLPCTPMQPRTAINGILMARPSIVGSPRVPIVML